MSAALAGSKSLPSLAWARMSARTAFPCVLKSAYQHRHLGTSPGPPLTERWDSHMHVIDTAAHPFPQPGKTTSTATLARALENAQRLGLPNMVFVQVSKYGTDNAWVLDELQKVGAGRSRGVVAFDPEQIDPSTLQQWHRLGVRGVRLNFRSAGRKPTKAEIQRELRRYAERLRPLKTWSIGLYADMEVLDHVQPLVSELQVKIVLEHFASPAVLPLDSAKQPGWEALARMMEDSRVYVKLSAPYLFSQSTSFEDLESLSRSLITMRDGNGVVFASDWPHTQSPGYDAMPFMNKCIEWCRDEETRCKLFRDNARRLWDVD